MNTSELNNKTIQPANNETVVQAAGQLAALRTYTKRAVIYLRVSTKKQVSKDDDPDGYSLPAQREACERKAETLDAEVVEVFVDRGESAKTADRREFQRMLAFVKEAKDIDYVILDKVDRFARNRRDDANILFELRSVGTQLVSVKENIDETPAGQLLHAIMAGIAEFYSRNLATESTKGMTQKAKVGGTPGRAHIGYLNTRRRNDEGREVRVVVVDPDRAPLVQWAFEMYATGEWTVRMLTDALGAKGLKALPHGKKWLPGPLSPSSVARMLSNRYYIGKVIFKGVEYEGRHQPLVPESLFERVQEVLAAHDRAGERQRVHRHYLKGSVFCGQCGSRLCITQAKGRYLYFFCLGRHQRRTECTQPYLATEAIEAAVERHYQTMRLPETTQETVRAGLRAELDMQSRRAEPEIAYARNRVSELDQERRRLGRAVVTGAIPEDVARDEQARIQHELTQAQKVLATSQVIYAHIEDTLNRALALVGRVDEVYATGGPRVRRLVNQCFFDKLLISADEDEPRVAEATLREPWATLCADDFQVQMAASATHPGLDFVDQGLTMRSLVPRVGIEPTTPSLGRRRSIR
jgi:site-specific DNA recombinase